MTNEMQNGMTRRTLLSGAAVAATAAVVPLGGVRSADSDAGVSLGALAAEKGLTFGASFSTAELDKPYGAAYAAIYEQDARVLTSELEFKMGVLRPTAGAIDFAPADRLMSFAEERRLGVRGHTLIWNDYLPEWIEALGSSDAAALLERHVTGVMGRYRGRVASWDVVNEPIAPWDRLPGNLRKGAFLSALGEDYIARSFAIARKADPAAELVINEAQTESADENGETFRASFLALLKRLKAAGAEIDGVGLQCHLDSARPYKYERYAAWLEEIAALGYRILLTELDVNDRALPNNPPERDARVARIYRDFLSAVLAVPAVSTLTLWQLADHTSWITYGAVQGAPAARRRPRPLLYDDAFRRKPAWYAVAECLEAMPARK